MTAAKKLASTEAYLETGRVERLGPTLGVRLGAATHDARRAKSCLVAPDVGDKVLCAIEPEGVYLLAVLEGESDATRITADGDLTLQARAGRVAIAGAAGVDLVSGGDVAVSGAALHVRAQKGSVAIDELGYFGKLVRAEVGRVAVIAEEIDHVLGRLTQRAKRVFRFVEEIDQTRAGTVDLRAEGLLGLRGDNAVISARTLAKVDGEQIHLG